MASHLKMGLLVKISDTIAVSNLQKMGLCEKDNLRVKWRIAQKTAKRENKVRSIATVLP